MQARRGTKDKTKSSPVIRREEPAAPAHHGGAWKVAYADFVTAMMAFFLLMWLLNATTEDQRKGLADYFSPSNLMSHASSGTGQPFGGHTAFTNGALASDRGAVQIVAGREPPTEQETDDTDPGSAATTHSEGDHANGFEHRAGQAQGKAETAGGGSARRDVTSAPPMPARAQAAASVAPAPTMPKPAASGPPSRPEKPGFDAAAREQQSLSRAAEQIKEALRRDPALAGLAGQLAVDVTPEGLRLQLLDQERQAMFATGSAAPNERARLLIQKIAPVIAGLTEQIAISGYTDAAPYPGPERTNWELSAERANAARRMLIEAGLGDRRIRDVTGHADHDLLLPAQPLAPANRRIAIVLLRGTQTATPQTQAQAGR